jgi:hypothetical protein
MMMGLAISFVSPISSHSFIEKMVMTILKIEKKINLDKNLILLIRNFVSHLNECSLKGILINLTPDFIRSRLRAGENSR